MFYINDLLEVCHHSIVLAFALICLAVSAERFVATRDIFRSETNRPFTIYMFKNIK